jgi:UDP:flavonoid glycosyltransferase YjiC (YdhE family)
VRVLFSSHGAYGHVLPLTGLATALRQAGHEVRVAVGPALCPAVESVGLPTVAAGMSDDALVAEARRRWPETEHQPPANWAPRMFTDIAAPAMADDLVEIISTWRPDLVVREEGEYGGAVAAAAAGIRWITHAWGSPLPPKSQLAGVAKSLTPLWRAHDVDPPRDAEQLYGAAVLDPCPPSLYEHPFAGDLVNPIRPVPADLADDHSGGQLPRPLAYIGFGTVPLYRNHPELLKTAVAAVLATGLNAVVTTSELELPTEIRELNGDRVLVKEWVSLPSLLASCQLVISHGGAGTVLAALTNGLPLLLLPRGAPSQLRMSAACARRGAARVVEPERATRREIDDAIWALINDNAFAQAARDVAGEIAQLPHPTDVVRFIEATDG